MSRNGSADNEFLEHSETEATVVEEREGLAWLARRMREIRIAILHLMLDHGQLDLGLESELQRLEQEFQRRTEENEDE